MYVRQSFSLWPSDYWKQMSRNWPSTIMNEHYKVRKKNLFLNNKTKKLTTSMGMVWRWGKKLGNFYFLFSQWCRKIIISFCVFLSKYFFISIVILSIRRWNFFWLSIFLFECLLIIRKKDFLSLTFKNAFRERRKKN